VRELEESKYEVVAGARRLRAARIAELENLPVRIVKLTDAEAIEAQCVENLQRQDIHPLEEALGFRALLELGEPAYTIVSIAARTGKCEAYIYGRIRLADLIPPVAEAFLKDQITIGHALLIAKLPASQQQEAFTAAFRGMWTSEGNTQVLIPVRELGAWIESNILLQLASVPFDKQDETLVPEAGSCANCPKRTGFNKLLFPDVQKDSCIDAQCLRHKLDVHISKTLESKPKLVQISSAWNSREGAPKHAHDIITAQQAVHLVSEQVGVAILTKPTALNIRAEGEGVVVKPLSDTSLCFQTCVIMRADDDSRLANEFARSFLRRYAPQRLPPKQMELWLSA
jgi:ParB family chromosome partitioning protein